MTASALIDEVMEDSAQDPRMKQDVTLSRIVQFYNWLKQDYERKCKGRGKHRILGKGVSDKLAHIYVLPLGVSTLHMELQFG